MMPTSKNYHILHTNPSGIGKQIIMIPITEKEENNIDNITDNVLEFHRGNRTFSVRMHNIYCYGEVNLEDKETCNKISNFNFLNYLGATGVHIYSNYDYNTHTCKTPKKYLLYTETWNPLDLVKFAHGTLNKPKRILLFYQQLKK